MYWQLHNSGGLTLPSSDGPRIIIGFWWIVVMVIVATYSGNLIAFLTFPRMDSTIDTIEDLIERRNEFTWGYANGSMLREYLEASGEDIHREILTGAQVHNPTESEKILELITNQKHVLIDWRSSLMFLMKSDFAATGKCNFHLGLEKFISEDLAMMVSDDSPYLRMINKEWAENFFLLRKLPCTIFDKFF